VNLLHKFKPALYLSTVMHWHLCFKQNHLQLVAALLSQDFKKFPKSYN